MNWRFTKHIPLLQLYFLTNIVYKISSWCDWASCNDDKILLKLKSTTIPTGCGSVLLRFGPHFQQILKPWRLSYCKVYFKIYNKIYSYKLQDLRNVAYFDSFAPIKSGHILNYNMR